MVPTERSYHKDIHVKYIKALALTAQKLLARLKFQRGGQNDRQKKFAPPPIFDPGA